MSLSEDYLMSEEEDEDAEVCYVEPPEKRKTSLSPGYLVDLFGDRIRKNPNWKLCDMKEEFKRILKVDVCEAKCCRVRQKALSAVEEKMQEHYANLRRFGGELLRSNKNNTVKIKTTRLQEGDEPRFQRIYICYDSLKKAWRNECRPVLGLDGCFFKSVCGGQLLSTVGRDGNNSILPIAMAVVESECYDSWKWFLELLIEDLDLGGGLGKTLISDQRKAIRELMPYVEHRFCTRHLVSNLSKVYPSTLVSNCFWNAATATYPRAFKHAMKELERASKGAAKNMKGLDSATWSKAYFSTHSMTDSTDNNMSECFNSWILKTRYMPIIDMLVEIHDMLMIRLHQKRDWMANRDCIIVPKAKQMLDLAVKDSVGYKALWDEKESYTVKGKGSSVCVSLKNRTCSCRIWDLTGVPCSHVVTAIQESRQNPIDYVAKWFTKETYMRCYSYTLEALKGEEFWDDVEGDVVLPPLIVKKLRGRPKKLRRREGWEGSVSSGKKLRMAYTGRVMHCGICREKGHNRSAYPSKTSDHQPPQLKKRGRKGRKEDVDEDEIRTEVELQDEEEQTGEADLMEEALRDIIDEDLPQMPTPSLRRCHVGTGSNPPASTPPNAPPKARGCSQLGSSQSQGPVTRTKAVNLSPVTRKKAASLKFPVKPFSAPRKNI
nr:PREDICTED: uncharacterized protein LOC108198146 [Daucus carota subsp. sativus]